MLTSWKKIRGSWVLSKNSDPLGRVRDLVINPETGEIPALWVHAPEGMKLLALSEITRWHSKEIFVETPTDLISPEEFPRLKNILEKEVPIINAPVFELRETPQKIGKCYNFTFETRSPRILSIETTKGWWLCNQKRIIPRTKIEEINNKGIFVTSTLLTQREESPQEIDILQNAITEAKTSQSFHKQ